MSLRGNQSGVEGYGGQPTWLAGFFSGLSGRNHPQPTPEASETSDVMLSLCSCSFLLFFWFRSLGFRSLFCCSTHRIQGEALLNKPAIATARVASPASAPRRVQDDVIVVPRCLIFRLPIVGFLSGFLFISVLTSWYSVEPF